jgi:hypothetical protein
VPAEGRILVNERYAPHTQGLAFIWGNAAESFSDSGIAVTESEVNRALAMALTDSMSPGQVDADERAVMTEVFSEKLASNATPGALAAMEGFFGAGQTSMTPEMLRAELAQAVYTYADDLRELTGDELARVVVHALSNTQSPGVIDEAERQVINAAMSDLPGLGHSPTEPGSPGRRNHAAPEAQYLYDSLRAARVL